MKIRLSILLVFIAALTHAQSNYMALSFGGGFPMADFASSTDIYTHGYANTGFMADYSGAYYIYDYVGFAGNIRFTSNLLKEDEVRRDLRALLPEDLPADIPTRLDVGRWDVISLTVGPQFSYPAGRVEFDAYFLVGLNVVSPPLLELTVEPTPGEYISTKLSSQNARFGWDAGINIRFNLSETSGLRFFVGYQHTSVKGELRGENGGQSGDYTPKIDLINSGIGLIYRL